MHFEKQMGCYPIGYWQHRVDIGQVGTVTISSYVVIH